MRNPLRLPKMDNQSIGPFSANLILMKSILSSNLLFSLACLATLLTPFRASAQRDLSGAAQVKLSLDRLSVVGSVMMIAAHPDDENTAVLAYFARGRKVDTAYLSLTRGEGGQNLIGSEQGDKLGVIRTQELLAARRIDGAHQRFTRAIDFGFTKTLDETLQKWGHDRILGDVVWNIRVLRPDVVILRFSGTPRDGHGQHQTSAVLGKEAFSAAADPARFPEQLRWVKPWKARRLLWNAFAFTREQEADLQKMPVKLEIDTGDYDPLLGHSYGEIAGMSRSMHRSQGMGAAERRGSMKSAFTVIGGEPATKDPFDGIDVSWNRLPGGAPVAELLTQAQRDFDAEHPEHSIAPLLKARPLIAAINEPYARQKLRDLDETLALCAGLWFDAAADHPSAIPGSKLKINITALDRTKIPVTLKRISWSGSAASQPAAVEVNAALGFNQPLTKDASWSVAPNQPYTQPYWLAEPKQGDTYTVSDQQLIGLPENPPLIEAHFELNFEGTGIEIVRTVRNRYVDRVRGEVARPLAIVPPVVVNAPENAIVFPTAQPKRIEIPVKANGDRQTGSVKLLAPAGWTVIPASRPFDLAANEQMVASFEVTPPSADSITHLRAVAEAGGREVESGEAVIDYVHIPLQTLFPRSDPQVVRATIRTLVHNVGYIMGAGDEVPQALKQMGCDVTMLSEEDLARGDFSRFEAIVTGVRAFNTRADLRANRQRIFEYVKNGGTMIVQYNVLEGQFGQGSPRSLDGIGPYPIKISNERVTVEDVPVTFPNPASPFLEYPNRITAEDFKGWVQERGLYFASEWDPRYQSLLESHDPGEKPHPGGTLYTQYGKGAYIFTAYSWFRELPAGVPGAYRIFANFLSSGKVLAEIKPPAQ
jgi:LmbE family N-acetylglucosaminyl deacetylase